MVDQHLAFIANCTSFDLTNQELLIGGGLERDPNGSFTILDMRDWTIKSKHVLPIGAINSVVFLPGVNQFCMTASSSQVHLVDRDKRELIRSSERFEFEVAALASSKDEQKVAVGFNNGLVAEIFAGVGETWYTTRRAIYRCQTLLFC